MTAPPSTLAYLARERATNGRSVVLGMSRPLLYSSSYVRHTMGGCGGGARPMNRHPRSTEPRSPMRPNLYRHFSPGNTRSSVWSVSGTSKYRITPHRLRQVPGIAYLTLRDVYLHRRLSHRVFSRVREGERRQHSQRGGGSLDHLASSRS